MRINRCIVGVGILLCGLPISLLPGCAASQARSENPEPPTLREWDEFNIATDEHVWIGGQPSEAALDQFMSEAGGIGGVIVNLRTDEEMAFLPYYDRSVAARGVRYVHIPTKGSSLNMEKVEALRDALGGHGGPVLLHCASGGRATYLWAMKRMQDEGISATEAAEWIESFRDAPSETGMARLIAFEAERDGKALPTD